MRSTGTSALDDTVKHIPKFGGIIWYVDGSIAASGDGTKPSTAFKTIGEAFTATSSGDAVNVRSGVYTETGLDLGSGGTKDYVELWCEIGTLIDPATGTALTVSGVFCTVKGNLKITPNDASIGLLITGNECVINNVTILEGSHNYSITGVGITLNNCAAGFPAAGTAGFNITGSQARLIDCNTVGDTTTYGFKISGGADTGVLSNCASAAHQTSGFFIDTLSQDWTLLNCSSGAGDGKWVDEDNANVWSNFSFDNKLFKSLNIAQAGVGTWEYNLFKVTGIVRINSIDAHVKTTLTGSNTVCYLDFYSVNGSEVITKATGTIVGAALAGSFLGRVDDDGVILAFHDAAGPGMIDSVDTSNQSFRLMEDRTGGAHVASYIRFIHTTAGASSGIIHWHIDWEPISPHGMVIPA